MLLNTIMESMGGEMGSQLSQFNIPPEKSADVFNLANSTLVDEFKSRADGNSLDDLLNLFNGKQEIGSSPLVNSLSGGFADQLSNKLGISREMAMGAATMVLPMILSKLNDATPSSGLSEDNLKDIVGGGGWDSIADKLKGFFS